MDKLTISSSAFNHEEPIPEKYVKDGDNISPPLKIVGVPNRVLSFSVIVDDPDAPLGDFVHWVAWNIDPDIIELKEGASVPNEGRNDFNGFSYDGPHPPTGRPHRYFFKVFALDTRLNLPKETGKHELLKAIDGHILAQGVLIGTFER